MRSATSKARIFNHTTTATKAHAALQAGGFLARRSTI